jgi:CP family cyanate transporter-like MFS transporter
MNAKNKTVCSTQHSSRLLAILLGVAVALMAFNLRIPIASIGPLLPEAIKSTGLSSGGASFLTALPTICFGLFSPVGPTLARRFGIERVLLVALLVIALGTAARGSATAGGLFSGQILACLGIAVVNVLLPGLVKRDFPRRVAFITGIYVMALCVFWSALGKGFGCLDDPRCTRNFALVSVCDSACS